MIAKLETRLSTAHKIRDHTQSKATSFLSEMIAKLYRGTQLYIINMDQQNLSPQWQQQYTHSNRITAL